MAKRLKGQVYLPGDKSISHRALMLAAISSGQCHVENLAQSLDVESSANCLRQLGVEINNNGNSAQVLGVGFRNFIEPGTSLDCGNSGTSLRLLTGMLSASNVQATLDGDSSLKRRPMGRVIEPLKKMGARIESLSSSDNCPVKVFGQILNGVSQSISVPSAQVKTAILFAGLLAKGATELEERVPTRDHTENILKFLGVDLRIDQRKIMMTPPGYLKAFDLRVPGDPSSAAFLIVAAALIPNSELGFQEMLLNPTRIGYIQILIDMGLKMNVLDSWKKYNERIGNLLILSSELKGITIDERHAASYIDEAPVLALAATQAKGRSVFKGLSELKVKESDRLAGIKDILNQMGGKITISGDDLIIDGPTALHYYDGECFGDHRLAMMIEVGNLISCGQISHKYEQEIRVSFKKFYSLIDGVMK
ncbi:MAG: 3-phosphoshikimate 1-carboxyvinyltransferase [candidate division Zixibacteria bacterium CG_4_9_14_3_um_filter_46_8]|nr:MAG: 3-phosphoshikimate 1-carboxyvinyltransferase [candidate division Zixibacteria bacterium CG_4_9_14_3_um_filter_46_8]